MNIRKIAINDLKPAPYNPRVSLQAGMPAYDRLARSLSEFDLVQPIVWNEQTGHVVSGHQRLQILKDRGEGEIDVAVVSLPLEREKALNVTLNNSQVGGDWDPAKLVDVIAELDALPDFDATLTGFDADDLNDLVLTPDPDFTPDEEEETDPFIKVVLEIPAEQWADVEPDLDQLIDLHSLEAHLSGHRAEPRRRPGLSDPNNR